MAKPTFDSDSNTLKYRYQNGFYSISRQECYEPGGQEPLDFYSASDQKQKSPELQELPGDQITLPEEGIPGHSPACYCGVKDDHDGHLASCDFTRVGCPNGCEGQYPRYSLPVHRQSCPKEVVPCTLVNLGCKDSFKREDQVSHDDSKFFDHMALFCSKAGNKYQEVQEKLQKNQERIKELENKSAELERERYNYKRMQKHQQEKTLTFLMKDYSKEKEETSTKSQTRTSKEGYKFCIGVYANGYSEAFETAMSVELLAMKGENDEKLRWPIQAHFTLRLVNFKGGEDKVVTESVVVQKTLVDYQHVAHFKPSSSHLPHAFIEHSKIPSFIEDDQLQFELLVVTDN